MHAPDGSFMFFLVRLDGREARSYIRLAGSLLPQTHCMRAWADGLKEKKNYESPYLLKIRNMQVRTRGKNNYKGVLPLSRKTNQSYVRK
jgi:hypothetical protein